MKKKLSERHSVNLAQEDFNSIKKYCDERSLSVPKWLAQIASEKFHEDPMREKLYNNFGKTNWVITDKAYIDISVVMRIHEEYIKRGEEAAKEACWEFIQEMIDRTHVKV
jgi:hypothetical protein